MHIDLRLSPYEKQRIKAKARKCGLSVTQYMKQLALGYEPKPMPDEAVFRIIENVGNLETEQNSAEVNIILRDLRESFIAGSREERNWQ